LERLDRVLKEFAKSAHAYPQAEKLPNSNLVGVSQPTLRGVNHQKILPV
jgi:hypothetical protein